MNRMTALLLALGAVAALFLFSRRASAAEFVEEWTDYDLLGEEPPPEEMIVDSEVNLAAFLKLIRQAESADNYYALVGGGNFSGTSDHPANTGEFAGIPTKDGRLTTAAGAYQITRTTWNDLGGVQKYGDFLPHSQDLAAVDLLVRRGALGDVQEGRFDIAIFKLRNEWEAFAMMLAGTYSIDLAQARSIYENAGGTFA